MIAYRSVAQRCGIALIVGGMFLVPRPSVSLAPCETAAEWVNENRDNLPATLAELSTLPMVYRKAVYAELSVADRRSLWRDHLLTFLHPANELTEKQIATVKVVLRGLDTYITEDPAVGHAAAEADGWTPERLANDFGALASAVFATLGPDDASSVAAQDPNCSCSVDSDWCWGSDNSCGEAVCNEGFGCGFLWCFPCDGFCFGPE